MKKWLLIALGVILILIAILPRLLSTAPGNALLVWAIEPLEAKSISLRWFGPQRVTNVHFNGSEAREVSTTMPLWALIFGSRNYRKVTIIEPKIQLDLNKQRIAIDAPTALFAGPPHTLPKGFPTGSFTIADGDLTIRSPFAEPTTLTGIQLDATLNGGIELHASGPFSIDVGDGVAKIQNLPTLLIDTALYFAQPNLAGMATQMLGPTVNLESPLELNKQGLFVGPTSLNYLYGTVDLQKLEAPFPVNWGTLSIDGSVSGRDITFESGIAIPEFLLGVADDDWTLDMKLIQDNDLIPIKASGSWSLDKVDGHFREPLTFTSSYKREGKQISVRGPHLTFEGQLVGGILTLRKPLLLSLEVTPEIGQTILQKLDPLFLNAVRSEAPITLSIDPDGFSLPVAPFTPSKLQIGKGVINLGKMWVKNEGFLKELLSLFKQPQYTDAGELRTWSTPLYLSARDGIIYYERMDTLIGRSLQIASWGKYNLVNNAIDITVGIPGPSLRALVGAPTISKSTYLLIPIKGTLPDVSVDWGKVTLRLAGLITGKKKAAPPPTTTPFPWEQKQ